MKWISVEASLPQKDGAYHVSLGNDPMFCCMHYWENGKWLIPSDIIEIFGDVVEWGETDGMAKE